MPLRYLSADGLLEDSQRLALAILDSGYEPDLLLGLWRGGTPIAIAIHEVFSLAGLDCAHAAIGASSYAGVDRQHDVRLHGLEILPPLLTGKRRLLLVDDVFDTGRTLATLVSHLSALLPSPPADLRIATPWYKPLRNQTALVPDYHLHATDDWLVFPHELLDLADDQLLAKPGDPALLQRLAALRHGRS